GQYICHSGMMRKVNDHIRFHRAQLVKGFAYAVFPVDADLAHHILAQNAANQFSHGAVGAAKYCFHTLIPSFLISAYSLARVSSSMGVRGRRRFSSPKPMAETAALTGMGLTSLNSALVRPSSLHCHWAAVL